MSPDSKEKNEFSKLCNFFNYLPSVHGWTLQGSEIDGISLALQSDAVLLSLRQRTFLVISPPPHFFEHWKWMHYGKIKIILKYLKKNICTSLHGLVNHSPLQASDAWQDFESSYFSLSSHLELSTFFTDSFSKTPQNTFLVLTPSPHFAEH